MRSRSKMKTSTRETQNIPTPPPAASKHHHHRFRRRWKTTNTKPEEAEHHHLHLTKRTTLKRVGTEEEKPAPIWTRGAEDWSLPHRTTTTPMSTSWKSVWIWGEGSRSEFF
jgi:hypothetical protein